MRDTPILSLQDEDRPKFATAVHLASERQDCLHTCAIRLVERSHCWHPLPVACLLTLESCIITTALIFNPRKNKIE